MPKLLKLNIRKGIILNGDLSLSKTVQNYFPDMFDVVYGSAVLKIRKPDHGFFEHAFSTAGVTPEQVLYIGDSPRLDMVPGLEVGFETCLIDRYNDFPYYRGLKINHFSALV